MAQKSFWKNKKDKKWISDFFFYYKAHIALLVFVIIGLAYGFSSCSQRAFYHMEAYYISDIAPGSDGLSAAEDRFAAVIDKAEGKGEAKVRIRDYSLLPDAIDDAQAKSTQATEIQLELAHGDGYLYIVDKNWASYCTAMGIMDDISALTGSDESQYFAELPGDELIEGYPPGQRLYLGLRTLNKDVKNNEGHKIKHKNAQRVLSAIIEKKTGGT